MPLISQVKYLQKLLLVIQPVPFTWANRLQLCLAFLEIELFGKGFRVVLLKFLEIVHEIKMGTPFRLRLLGPLGAIFHHVVVLEAKLKLLALWLEVDLAVII